MAQDVKNKRSGRESQLNSKLVQSFELLKSECAELYLPKEIPTLKAVPEPLQFYRNWVAPNIPLLIKGGIKNWPAFKKWNEQYFNQILKDKKISVAVTPNGFADAIAEKVVDGEKSEYFVLPEERLMTISEFLKKLDGGLECVDSSVRDSQGIFYIQKQNSNLTEDFPELLPDIDQHMLWASEAFGSPPTAINLWIGDKRAVTSLHKDPFENIYCVISGYKDFTLLPPTDRPWLPYKTLPVGQYKEVKPGVFDIVLFQSEEWTVKNSSDMSKVEASSVLDDEQGSKVPWIAIDADDPDYTTYPKYRNANPLKVRVEQGDMLYLPSLWFHHVRQSHQCIAVNYWYDMCLDIKYAYFQFLESLSKGCDS